jgi:hypothetical protein
MPPNITDTKAEGVNQPSGRWSVETLKEFTITMIGSLTNNQTIQMDALKALLKERFDAQTKAGEVAFTAQQTALTTGLLTAERGVETALAAAKEATNKAEINATARFEQFRNESGLQNKTLSDKLDSEIGRVTERLGELANRLDLTIGKGIGVTDAQTKSRLDNGQLLAGGSFLIALTAIISSFFLR